MKKQTKVLVGVVVVVLVAAAAVVFSNTGLMKGSMQGLNNPMYKNASVECYDGSKSNQGDLSSCKTKSAWSSVAATFCKNKCAKDTKIAKGKCGVNTFGVSNSCKSIGQPAQNNQAAAPAANNSDPMYVNANWKCHGDAVESLQGGGSSCKPRSLWLSYATTACTGKSDPVTGKTGISTFGVSNPCGQQPAAAAGQSALSSNGNVVDVPPASSAADQAQNNNAADAPAALQPAGDSAELQRLCTLLSGSWNADGNKCRYFGQQLTSIAEIFQYYCNQNGGVWTDPSTCTFHGSTYQTIDTLKTAVDAFLAAQKASAAASAAAPAAGQDDAATPPAMSAKPENNNDVSPASSARSEASSDSAPGLDQPQ